MVIYKNDKAKDKVTEFDPKMANADDGFWKLVLSNTGYLEVLRTKDNIFEQKFQYPASDAEDQYKLDWHYSNRNFIEEGGYQSAITTKLRSRRNNIESEFSEDGEFRIKYEGKDKTIFRFNNELHNSLIVKGGRLHLMLNGNLELLDYQENRIWDLHTALKNDNFDSTIPKLEDKSFELGDKNADLNLNNNVSRTRLVIADDNKDGKVFRLVNSFTHKTVYTFSKHNTGDQ